MKPRSLYFVEYWPLWSDAGLQVASFFGRRLARLRARSLRSVRVPVRIFRVVEGHRVAVR